MKLPALQFYPGDWRKDPGVQSLTYEERGIWIEILFLMHESDSRGTLTLNGHPISDERLAILLKLDKQKITTVITTLLELGVASLCPKTGALMNRRMVRDEEIISKRRESGRKGGNPAFEAGKHNPYYNQADKQRDKQTNKQVDKRKITPSSSSSTSITSSEEKKERREAKPRDPRIDHPALKAVVEVKGSYPHKDTWDLVIKVVGEEPDVGRLRECWVAWRAKGFAPMNLGWLTDWYVNGVNGNGHNGSHRPDNYQTPAQRGRAAGFAGLLSVVDELREASSGGADETLRRKSLTP